MKLIFLFHLFFLLAITSCAQKPGRWTVDGEPVGNTSDAKAINGFGAHLVVVEDPKAFIEMWQRPEKPNFTSVNKTGYGKTLGIVVLFAGCTPNAEGRCDSEVDFIVEKPDGTELLQMRNQVLWDLVPPPKENTQLSKAVVGFNSARSLPVGGYRVRAKVRDKVAHIDIELETRFTLVQ